MTLSRTASNSAAVKSETSFHPTETDEPSQDHAEEQNSTSLDCLDDAVVDTAFLGIVPHTLNPAHILEERFQAWRGVIKELISHFKMIADAEETQRKDYDRISNAFDAFNKHVRQFDDSTKVSDLGAILRDSCLRRASSAEKVRSTTLLHVITRLESQRAELHRKVKDIANVAHDFKNNLGKETEHTKHLADVYLSSVRSEHGLMNRNDVKNDPYLLRLGVEAQLRQQMTEENYLHQAHLNLQASGRALESAVITEISSALHEYLKVSREAAHTQLDITADIDGSLLSLADCSDWDAMVDKNEAFVDPSLSIRSYESVLYMGRDSPIAQEVRSGNLERRTKYLRSYTSGWYVLTGSLYLHQFKSPDRFKEHDPVMSLYLPDCKLGEHSKDTSLSHKFTLKGKQTGQFHRGHSWIFRAESYEVMMQWYDDIARLSKLGGASRREQTEVVAHHNRSNSSESKEGSTDTLGVDYDVADETPYAEHSEPFTEGEYDFQRPEGGRFSAGLKLNTVNPTKSDTDSEDDLHAFSEVTVKKEIHISNSQGDVVSEIISSEVSNDYRPNLETATR